MAGKDRRLWTVLIYMVADDPQGGKLLDEQAIREMDQIIKATLSVEPANKLRVALQIDFRTFPGVWRRVIGEDTFVSPESTAADPATLYGFFDWAVNECPAEHYLLMFWGHSRGQFGMFGDSDPFDYTAQTLTLEELREALTAAKRSIQKPVDIIAFKDCFMANLETAYELNGLADYLLASPGLVPVEGWPYDEIFKALANDKTSYKAGVKALDAAGGILNALEAYYGKEDDERHKPRNVEVPYSLLNTAGAVPVVKALKALIGEDRNSVDSADKQLHPLLNEAADAPGDRALADLGQMMRTAALKAAAALKAEATAKATKVSAQAVTKAAARRAAPDAKAAAKAAADAAADATRARTDAPSKELNEFLEALGNAEPKKSPPKAPHGAIGKPSGQGSPQTNGLVVNHTGDKFGGVSVFVYPTETRDQRDSLLTRLADEKAYRRLAISQDTRWADIALRRMPVPQVPSAQDASKSIALYEQLARLGVGIDSGSAARASMYLRRDARLSRNGDLTDADVTEAAQYAVIAELAVRLADFAASMGGAAFVSGKPGAVFASGKPGAVFASGKPGAVFASGKPGAVFGPDER